jgi:hypothetical protein
MLSHLSRAIIRITIDFGKPGSKLRSGWDGLLKRFVITRRSKRSASLSPPLTCLLGASLSTWCDTLVRLCWSCPEASGKVALQNARPKLLKLCFLVLMALTSHGMASTPSRSAVNELPQESTPIDDVLVPIPRKVFESLDQFANSNWVLVQRRGLARWRPHGDQAQIALLLGALVAEGIIAVEARDADQVKSIGRSVLKVAAALGVRSSVLRRSRAIIESAERSDWKAARQEWDGVFADVEGAMRELKSEQLSQLVSLGGWLRGTEALTGLILQNYSTDGAELLRQPASLDYFDKRIREMDRELRSRPLVVKMQQGIRKIRPLLRSEDDASVSKRIVNEVRIITKELVEEINLKLR